MHRLFLLMFALYVTSGVAGESISLGSLPDTFKRSIPAELKGGLVLVELTDRCTGCEPWRYVDFYSNSSAEPIKREKVTVTAGYRAMYAYPDTYYFSNTKIEQSAPDCFEADKQIVTEAIRQEYRRKKERVESYLAANPQVRERVDAKRIMGKDYIEFEEGERNGIRFVTYVENVIGLTGSTISQVHFFVPATRITVTAYLLKQERAKFTNIEEFRKLRQEFIDGYAEFLASPLKQ
jgi:hypothetical protein